MSLSRRSVAGAARLTISAPRATSGRARGHRSRWRGAVWGVVEDSGVKQLIESEPVNWIVLVLAVIAGIVLIKTAAAYLPSDGIPGATKRVISGV